MRSGRDPVAVTLREEGEQVVVLSPAVGLFRGMPEPGAWLAPGCSIGWIETLAEAQPLVLPPSAGGKVLERVGPGRRAVPVGYGAELLRLDRSVAVGAGPGAADEAGAEVSVGLVFPSPMGGRFYSRPGPGKDAFVEEGAIISVGHTLCLLEVMKTFNRIAYGGAGLPENARVLRVFPAEGEDIGAGDPIVEVEPA